MEETILRSFIFLIQLLGGLPPINSVNITSLWVPSTFLTGSVSSVVLDCVYNFTELDRDSLEVKWYFRHNPSPIYQWIPPGKPQVLSKLFKEHLVPQFEVTQEPYTRYRALNLVNMDTTLSGVYSCRISSNLRDSFKSKLMTIYSPPENVELSVHLLSSPSSTTLANLTCLVGPVYPQPSTRIVRTTQWGTVQDLTRWSNTDTVWENGSFHQTTYLTLPVREPGHLLSTPYLTSPDLVQCEVTLPGTPYKEIFYHKFGAEDRANNIVNIGWNMQLNCGLVVVALLFALLL